MRRPRRARYRGRSAARVTSRAGPFGPAKRSTPTRSADAGFVCAYVPLCALRYCASGRNADEPPSSPDVRALDVKRCCAARASVCVSTRVPALSTHAGVNSSRTGGEPRRRCAWSTLSHLAVEQEGPHLRVEPWRGRWQSPAWLNVRRVSPHARDGFPHARTRQPALSAICRRACPHARASVSVSPACRSSRDGGRNLSATSVSARAPQHE
jgi:hypothetical protein